MARDRMLEALDADTPEVPPEEVELQLGRLDDAIRRVRATLVEHVTEEHGPAEADRDDIIAAHLLMLDDEHFTHTIRERIQRDRIPAEYAVEHSFTEVANRLVLADDPYLRARAEEIRDLCQSLRRALSNPDDLTEARPTRDPVVCVSACLAATTVLRARRAHAAAFVTTSVAFTSHGAILLRTSGIPALGGVDLELAHLAEGTPVVVNANDGHLIVHPTARQRATAERVPTGARSRRRRSLGPLPIDLEDGSTLALHGNIDHPSQVGLCLEQRLSGVGLFRTEFLVLEAGRVPGEEEQVARYRGVFEEVASLPIVIRTFDLGGDKTVSGLQRCTGPNPALGVRGLRRHLLRHPKELKSQLSAILRAAEGHRVGVLLPMVTGAADVVEARALLEATRNDLLARGRAFNGETRLGAMIEVPSAALTLGEILPLVDFVSIGTNDLLQYLTASDRNNEEVLRSQVPATSGLRTLLELMMETARSSGREGDVAVCGELASTPEGARFLVRLGIRSLSVLPAAAPALRATLGSRARSSR